MGRRFALALVIICAVSGVGCEVLISDAATRLAYGVRDGAARLKSSRSETLVLSVSWRAWPDGCADGYRVDWDGDNEVSPGIGVACTTGRRTYSTTYYRNFVQVPKSLHVTKAKGEPATIALRKRADRAIDVVALE